MCAAGLKSRFTTELRFADYTANELKRIDNLILREGSRMRRARTLWVPKSTLYVRDDVLEVPVGHSLVRSMRGKWSVTYPAPAAGR